MIPGVKYRVIFLGPQKKREMVAKFISLDETHYYFDLRPIAGTQTLRRREVSAIYSVHSNEKLLAPRTYEGVTRLL